MPRKAETNPMRGRIYVKSRGVIIKKESFSGRLDCRCILRKFIANYPDFEITIMDDTIYSLKPWTNNKD